LARLIFETPEKRKERKGKMDLVSLLEVLNGAPMKLHFVLRKRLNLILYMS
jgi:hypothetical protein